MYSSFCTHVQLFSYSEVLEIEIFATSCVPSGFLKFIAKLYCHEMCIKVLMSVLLLNSLRAQDMSKKLYVEPFIYSQFTCLF